MRTPGGWPPWMAALLGSSQDGESENGGGTSRTVGGVDLTRKVLSFVAFFAPAKKVTRHRRKPSSPRIVAPTRSTPFALSGEVLSFADPKESTQRKWPTREFKNAHEKPVLRVSHLDCDRSPSKTQKPNNRNQRHVHQPCRAWKSRMNPTNACTPCSGIALYSDARMPPTAL